VRLVQELLSLAWLSVRVLVWVKVPAMLSVLVMALLLSARLVLELGLPLWHNRSYR
jgi:hypothetical protein